MNKKYIFLLFILISMAFPAHRHFNNNSNKNKNNKKNIKSCELVVSPDDSNYYCYKGYKVPKLFFSFIQLSSVSCEEFMLFAINNYAFSEKKDLLRDLFYSLSPSEVWQILNASQNFPCDFITMINDIYVDNENQNQNKFILMYEARMTIELILFAFNIKENTTKYKYTYLQNIELKKVLQNLLYFINEADYLFKDKFSQSQLEDVKKFLNKYIVRSTVINHMNFLSDLKQFKYMLEEFAGGNKDQANLTLRQQFAIMNRFATIFKK